jgi:hypothetical protein
MVFVGHESVNARIDATMRPVGRAELASITLELFDNSERFHS